MSSAVSDVAFYYPGPVWYSSEVIKNLLLFFDGIALLVPEYIRDKPERLHPELAGSLVDKGLLHILEPEKYVDINLVRTTAGGLDAIAGAAWAAMTVNAQLDELLYNKRYSLLFEGGYRWIDMRLYDKLDEITLSVSTNAPAPAFTVPTAYPVPTQECDARASENVPSC